MPVISVMVSLVLIKEIDECANDQCNGSPCFDFRDRRVCQ